MAEIYMYADETGNLDLKSQPGASQYFGFGTAVFGQDHGESLWGGLQLRARLEIAGTHLPRGFHAKNDRHSIRGSVYELIKDQKPRFDMTFLYKPNAYPYVREKGEMYLYQLAWYMHFKKIALDVTDPNNSLNVIVGTFGTKARAKQARTALQDVCQQVARNREINLCVWESCTSWGLQVADYALWATQRHLEGRECVWYKSCIDPTVHSVFRPWGP